MILSLLFPLISHTHRDRLTSLMIMFPTAISDPSLVTLLQSYDKHFLRSSFLQIPK